MGSFDPALPPPCAGFSCLWLAVGSSDSGTLCVDVLVGRLGEAVRIPTLLPLSRAGEE